MWNLYISYRASAPQEILVLTIDHELSRIEIILCDKAASFKSTEFSAELQSNSVRSPTVKSLCFAKVL